MFIQSGVPHCDWLEVFSSVIYILNRIRTPTLNNKNPLELSTGKSPDYTILKTIGCACFPLLPKQGRDKLIMAK